MQGEVTVSKKRNVKNSAVDRKEKPAKSWFKPVYLLILVAIAIAVVVIINLPKEEIVATTEESPIIEAAKPVATIEMENGGIIRVELNPAIAPNTVKNFIYLAEQGYYDGLIFHRIVPGFVIQGGCPQGLGTGNPGYSIKGEFNTNNHENPIIHERGVISMARSNHPDSAGSQFFITVDLANNLDGSYAAFGIIIEGMEIVDEIAAVERDQNDRPLVEQRIKTIMVETFGVEYGEPERL